MQAQVALAVSQPKENRIQKPFLLLDESVMDTPLSSRRKFPFRLPLSSSFV